MRARHRGNVWVGPAGWAYKDWNGIVYPVKRPKGFSPVRYLSQFFDTIEINSSFYGPPTPSTAKKWIEESSDNARFLFTAKLWRVFTHEFELTSANEAEFRPGMEALRDNGKLGALLIQFPWSFKNEPERQSYLDRLCKRFADFPLVVEVRHASWNQPAFFEWLVERGIGIANIDQPLFHRSIKPDHSATTHIGYVRLHGRNYQQWWVEQDRKQPLERYNYLYSVDELEPWVDRIRTVAAKTEKTFAVTNNHNLGKAVVNAAEIESLLEGGPVEVPASVVEKYPRLREIAKCGAR